jgi:predicted oxidoreductase
MSESGERTVVALVAKRPPSAYTVEITHHWDGTIEAFAHDVSDSERSQDAVWWAMCELATKHMTTDQIAAALLHRANALMDAGGEKDVAELKAVADACQVIEALLYP